MEEAPRDVVVTGLGAVCALAHDHRALWGAIEAGRDGIQLIRRFPVEGLRARMGAIVQAWAEPLTVEGPGTGDLCRRFAVDAASEALQDAGLDVLPVPRNRIGLVLGTGLGGADEPIHTLAERVADELRLNGPRIVVSTACSSSTGALGLARDLLAMGAADFMVAGGADVLSPEVFAGFYALGVLSSARCAPFSYPLGTTLGEGAGFLVLERSETAGGRQARCRAVLSGYGLSGDAFHETSPDPTGSGVERALRGALHDAALPAEAIGYVNVHGSGTEANDPAEWRGIQRGLGRHARSVPVSSTKGALGHAQGAAGVLEAIVTILAMERGVVPPTLHFAGPRPHAPADPVGEPRPRACSYEHALCLNSAFGGANAAVVLSRPGRPPRAAPRRPVGIFGVGLVGPWGFGSEAFLQSRADGSTGPGGRVPRFSIQQFIPRADPRGLDPMSRFLTVASALALADAGVTLRGEARDRVGLLVGATRPSPESVGEFHRCIRERGLHGLSAAAFARIVLNAPGGFCSKLLSLRGPHATVSTGAGSGLSAVALAAEFLCTRDDVDWLIAGGVMEDGSGPETPHNVAGMEGACALMLGVGIDGAARSPGAVRVAGWGIAGPGQLAEAIERARESLKGAPDRSEQVFSSRGTDGTAFRGDGAAASAAACAAAVLSLRRGEVERALVVSDSDRTVSVALFLTP
jgi:3-oxoacyl-[acyl-carrier-protein] synthase II